MNKLLIGQGRPQNLDKTRFYIQLSNSSQMLGILRSDHFVQCQIQLPNQTTNSQLRFLMHTTRILTKQGRLLVKGTNQGISKVKNIIKNLGLFIVNQSQSQVQFSKNQPKIAEPQIKKQVKLAIGFKNLEEQQIDEDELLKNQNIDLTKASGGGCAQKPRACANCTCGRKEMEQNISKQQLLKSINEGQPVSGCGKCYLGDSFRCATCPYKGLPAFKPGDKLKLVDDTKVVVQSGATVVSNGKVKIQL